MDFILKVALSFIVGGGYVSGVVWLSEHVGPKVGAAVAGIPSTILIGLIFINLTEGPEYARSAVSIVPVMIVATLVYTWVFVQTASQLKGKNKHLSAAFVALATWLIAALIIRKVFTNVYYPLILLSMFLGSLLFVYIFRNFKAEAPKKIPQPRHIYVIRFFAAGIIIAGSVVGARLAGPTWGGLIASAPALIGTSLYFLNKSQGGDFTKGFIRHLPASYGSSLTFLIITHETLTRIFTPLSFLLGMASAATYSYILVSSKKVKARWIRNSS